jgi:Ser/Thr protein kinase RdoA (MazF antagonist)
MTGSNKEFLSRVVRHFDLGSLLRFKDAGGYANRNLFIDTTKGSYVVKILQEHGPEALQSEALYLDRVASTGFPSPTYLSGRDGSSIYLEDGQNIVIMPLLEGNTLDKISIQQMESLGSALARLHLIDCRDLPIRRTWWRPNFLGDGLSNAKRRYSDQALSRLERRIASLTEFPVDGLARSIVHGDPRSVNALFHNHQVTALIDWEETTIGFSIFDLAHLAIFGCLNGQEFDSQRFNALIDGYQSIRDLWTEERRYFEEAVRYVACVTYLWLILREDPDEGELEAHWASNWYWNLAVDRLKLAT